MIDTLASYHVNKSKFGEILSKAFDKYQKKNLNATKAKAAISMGISDDIFANMLKGKNQDCLVDRLLKFCIHTGTPILDVIDQTLENADIDFADKIAPIFAVSAELAEKYGISVDAADASVIDGPTPAKQPMIRQTEIIAQKTEIMGNAASLSANAISPEILSFVKNECDDLIQNMNRTHDAAITRLADQYKGQILQLHESRQITINQFEERFALLKDEHAQHVADIKESQKALNAENKEKFDSVCDLYQRAVRRKNAWIGILSSLFILETIVITIFLFL